jgi:hypothetical protein
MRWIKLGKVFDPRDHQLLNGCVEYAQSPQALVFNEFVRVYFSTRSIDPVNGKYLSHIAFVDMKKNLREVIKVSDQVVIPLGGLGCFDEHGIFPMNVFRQGDLIYGYTCGWSRRVSVSVETAIGLALSTDNGVTFQRIGDGPIMSASQYEPCLVGDGFVKVINGVFHMWYIFGSGWKKYVPEGNPERTYKIAHATSMDGINWIKEEARSIITSRLGPDESQALPTVITIENRHHMFFCYRESFDFRKTAGRGYRIGHAWSDDLINWTRDDENLVLDGSIAEWDGEMQCYPHVFESDNKIFMLYNGNEFGRYGFGLAELSLL